jgi:NADH-quinone oxidoreductase subunit G
MNSAFEAVMDGIADTVIILENDLYGRADKDILDTFLDRCKHVIVIDALETYTTSRAEIILPAGTFAETDGTIVNNEGRAQRFFKVLQSGEGVQESWRWLLNMMSVAEMPEADQWKLFEDITFALSEAIPFFGPIREVSPPAGFRIGGMKIPRQPHRYSGRTAMHSHISVHEPQPPGDPDSPLSFSMEGYEGIPPSPLITRFWSPGWNSVQAVNKFQSEIGGPLNSGDPGKRLIEPVEAGTTAYFVEIPAAFEARDDEILIIPLHHIFGSEELSSLSPPIAERAPQPYLGFGPDDMKSLQLKDGDKVETVLNNMPLLLPVKCIDTLPQGIGGLPTGLPGLRGIRLAAWAKIPKRKGTS